MNRDQKRFTISVTPELAAELTAVKQSSAGTRGQLPAPAIPWRQQNNSGRS